MQVTARAKDPATVLPDTPSSPADIIASAKIPTASPTGSHGVQTATLLDVDGHAAGEVVICNAFRSTITVLSVWQPRHLSPFSHRVD